MPKEQDFRYLKEHIDYLIDEMPRELYACVRTYEKWRLTEGPQVSTLESLTKEMTKHRTRIKNTKRLMAAERKISNTPTERYDKLFTQMVIDLMKAEYYIDEFRRISINEIGDDLSVGVI